VKAAGVTLAIALALVLQTTLARFIVRGTVAVDLVLVVVVYVALSSGSTTGLLAGTVAGLIQDSLSTGLIGIGGLAKTLVGFLAGIDAERVRAKARSLEFVDQRLGLGGVTPADTDRVSRLWRNAGRPPRRWHRAGSWRLQPI